MHADLMQVVTDMLLSTSTKQLFSYSKVIFVKLYTNIYVVNQYENHE